MILPASLLLLVLVPLAPAPGPDALHDPFTQLLGAHVTEGLVDYTGLARDPAGLDAYLADLAEVDPATLGREARVAFWLNAYNAFTLRLILDHHGEIDSIKDISRGDRWKARRWTVHGERYSLDQIEHEILRPMGDPRVHFALVCASVSCPDLRPEAYLPSRLDEQLDEQARRFLADESKGLRVATESGWFGGEDHILYLSAIFDWFEEDFEGEGRDVVDFVLPLAPADAAAYIRRHRDDLDVEHLDYDWSLNGR